MRLDEKARENVEAVERLLSTVSDTELPLNNAAASRAYDAAYQAVADRALAAGVRFDSSRAEYYRHDLFPALARDSQVIDDDQSDELRLLYGLRIKADYMEDQVEYDEAARAASSARLLVDALLGAPR